MADKSNHNHNNNVAYLKLPKLPPPTAVPFTEDQSEQNERPDVSEIKKLSIIRETFKRKTQTILDESLKNTLEEKQSKLLKVKKLRRLADTNKLLLSQLHNQRTTLNKRLAELAKLWKSLGKSNENSQKEKQIAAENLQSTAKSIKMQLEEFKNN